MLTRRGFLVGAGVGVGALAATALVGDRVLESQGIDGRNALGEVFGRGVGVSTASFDSARMGTDVTWATAVPHGVSRDGLPMVLALHGRGGDAKGVCSGRALKNALTDHVRDGGQPFAVVAVDGGDHGYWHPRTDGTDPLHMITTELLPRAADLGLRTDRIGVMGWSMGGYGSLMLARESARGRLAATTVVAATASGPALWPSAGLTAPGAFDSPADFARWGDLVAHPGVGGIVPVRVDCGDSDPFAPTVHSYLDAVRPRPAGGFGEGGHDSEFWDSVTPEQVAFLGEHLRST